MPRSMRGLYLRTVWPAAAIDSAPKAVRDAWASHEDAADKVDAARRDTQAALALIASADRDDDAAALEAVSTGKPIPERTKEAKKHRHDEARRRESALISLAEQAENALIAAAVEHRDEWFAAVGPDLEASIDRAVYALRAAEDALTEVAGLAAVYRWLEAGRLSNAPSVVLPDDARSALAAGRAALDTLTPLGIQMAQEERKRKEAELADELKRSVGGVVVRQKR